MKARSACTYCISAQRLALGILVLALLTGGCGQVRESVARAGSYEAYYGNYRIAGDHLLGIDQFIMDSGEKAMLISDYSSGVVRRLFPVSDTEFMMGPGFNTKSPAELTVHPLKDEQGALTGISLRYADGTKRFAERVPLKKEEVFFQGKEAKLAGTLIMPAAKGPHPAIILLHGSGPLTRYSFGPYPHFFTSLGLAVLIYDKRGTGASTGTRLDASSGAVMTSAFYPDDLASDALAALRFLQRHEEIDPKQIGFWGSSEGGMLTTQVAAHSKDVAFAINSSGFMGPFWETLRYQVGSILRAQGVPEAEIEKELALADLWLHVARTGRGFEQFQKQKRETVESDGSWFFQWRGEFDSIKQLHWDWEHVLSFNPLRALATVTCPVLGVFGELDVLTEATVAAKNMQRVLTKAGHEDFTIKVFPNAGHSLSVMPSKDRMAPGVFETLRSWLLERVQVAKSVRQRG